MKAHSTDLQDAATPEDVPAILRNAAERYRQSAIDLPSDWGDKNAGKVWDRIANRLEGLANTFEKFSIYQG